MIYKRVVTDFENPGVELFKIGKRIARKIGFDVGFLRNIIGERGIAATQSHQKASERFLRGIYMGYKLLAGHIPGESVFDLFAGHEVNHQVAQSDCERCAAEYQGDGNRVGREIGTVAE